MWKKIFIVVLSLLFLSSCWESEGTSADTEWLFKFKNSDFSIQLPSSWDVIDNDDNTLPNPSNGVIELAASSKTAKSGVKNNILILSDTLNSFTTSKEFSILNSVWASRDYVGYRQLESKELLFTDDEASVLYVFEAKYNLDTPSLKFLQTAYVCGQNKAFLLTIAVSKSVKDLSRYEQLLSSFNCKVKSE